MPKKFTGENSKAAAARARKEAVRKGEAERKKQAEEDAYWRDDDKGAMRKQQRKVSFFRPIHLLLHFNLHLFSHITSGIIIVCFFIRLGGMGRATSLAGTQLA